MTTVSPELYYRYAIDAVSRGAIKELRQIWKNSLDMGSTGEVLRTTLLKMLPEVARMHDIVLPEDSTFQEFLKLYKTKKIHNRCERGPEHCLVYYARKQNLEGVKYALAGTDLDIENPFVYEASRVVGEVASPEFVRLYNEELQKKFQQSYDDLILEGAVKAENTPVIDYFLEQDLSDVVLFTALRGAIQAQSLGWIYFFLGKKGVLNGNHIAEAAKTGNRKILDFVITKTGPTPPPERSALLGAVAGGHRELVDHYLPLIILNDQWRLTMLNQAIRNGNTDLINLFLTPSNTINALIAAARIGNMNLIKWLYEKLPKGYNKGRLVDALSVATYAEEWTAAKFFLDLGVSAEYLEPKEIERITRFG